MENKIFTQDQEKLERTSWDILKGKYKQELTLEQRQSKFLEGVFGK
jgi:hypothetical protein